MKPRNGQTLTQTAKESDLSLCPYCHEQNKNFFAPKCHNCMSEVGFVEQIAHSLLWTVVQVVVVFLGLALVYWALT